ncbi:MAG: FAD-binding oxidoreductase [Nitrospiria bacterium]
MTPQQCLAKVTAITQLTHDVKEIALEMIDPPRLVFQAGQYIAIEITEMKDGRPRQNNRPYSIASPPEEDSVIKLCVNLVAGGPGSTYLHGLRIGEEVPFLYPFGYFTIKRDAPAFLFVATGTGIAPVYAMILHLLNRGSQRPMTLYWGLRSERDLYYQEAFAILSKQHPFFRCVTTLSQPAPDWPGARGRVTAHLAGVVEETTGLEAYLCGNMAMIREVRTMLLEQGMDKKAIHFEKFY